jgi:hypothetical protein
MTCASEASDEVVDQIDVSGDVIAELEKSVPLVNFSPALHCFLQDVSRCGTITKIAVNAAYRVLT